MAVVWGGEHDFDGYQEPRRHDVVLIGDEQWVENVDGTRNLSRLHEVTHIDEDGIEVAQRWVDLGDETFKCPLCGDEVPEASR